MAMFLLTNWCVCNDNDVACYEVSCVKKQKPITSLRHSQGVPDQCIMLYAICHILLLC